QAGLLHVGDNEFEFHEAASDSNAPEFRSWPSMEPERAARASASTPKNEPIAEPDWSLTELRARQILHAMGADLGEQIEIRRSKAGVEIGGVVDSKGRKAVLAEALSGVPGLRIRLVSPEDGSRGSRLPAGTPIESIV